MTKCLFEDGEGPIRQLGHRVVVAETAMGLGETGQGETESRMLGADKPLLEFEGSLIDIDRPAVIGNR